MIKKERRKTCKICGMKEMKWLPDYLGYTYFMKNVTEGGMTFMDVANGVIF